MQEFLSGKTPVYAGEILPHVKEFVERYKRVFFLADFRTLRKCLPFIIDILPENFECHSLVIQEGERFKNINTCILLWKQLQELEAHRDDLIVNVGGGVVCDIGAFVASTFKRGMPFINVPTSLMAMVDAAIGGKAGVDLEMIKNQVGLFTEPEGIYIYPPFLETLDRRQVLNGFAEVVKHALIADEKLWKKLVLKKNVTADAEIITQSVAIKIKIVTSDFKESGKRKTLNFGHTFGHAFETYSYKHDSHPILHGEAIAMGMLCEVYLSTQLNGLPAKVMEELKDYILHIYPKYNFSSSAIPELIKIMRHDKKNNDERFNLSLLKEIGLCSYNIYVNENDIVTALNVYHDLKS